MSGAGLLERPAPSGGAPLPQLDALRGAAILAVFTQHFGDRFLPFVEERVAASTPAALAPWILTVIHHAFWGVDLFFVLSGFTLARGYLAGRAPSAGRFFLRRAARIFPGYLVALAVTLAFHRFVFESPSFPMALAAHLLVLQGYWAPGGVVIIGALWSLTTEVHYYLLAPFLSRWALTNRRLWLLGLVVLGSFAARAACHAAFLDEPGVRTWIFEASQRRWITSRLDEFVLGAMAAALHASAMASPHRARLARLAPAFTALAAALVVVSFRLEGELYLMPGGSWTAGVMALGTASLVLSVALLEGRALSLAAPRWLRAVGVVSYGVFLYHQLAQGIVGARLPGTGWPVLLENLALSLALALGMGAASWVVVERPAIAWVGRLEERRRARALSPILVQDHRA